MAIKMLAKFDDWKPGDIVRDATPEQEEWLVSRQYAVRVEDGPLPPPMQPEPPKKPLTTRKKNGRS